jgi:hypothetical protein
VIALRFRVGSELLAVMESARTEARIYSCRLENHAHLELPRTFDEFLARVGPSTRHNLGRYRRRSEAADNEYRRIPGYSQYAAERPAKGHDSVSLVLRSYLIKMLVKREFREISFWAGTSAPLSSYTTRREEFVACVDTRSHHWRMVQLVCATLAKLAPFSLGDWLKRVAPNAGLGG